MPRLAVLGQPISHSRSPAMHTAALAAMGLDGEWSYEAIEVSAEDFEGIVRSLPDAGFAGVNVTVPHKLAALDVADEASPSATAIGAANTLTFLAGKVHADNTDAAGIVAALPRSPKGMRALVLGAGGSARAAIWALREAGAEVSVWNRTGEKAAALAAEFGVKPALGRQPQATSFDLILNSTTVGLAAANSPQAEGKPPAGRGDASLEELGLGVDAFRADQVVVDLVYGKHETHLARAARQAGAEVVDGLEVLVRQGAASLRLWLQAEPPLDTMRQAAAYGRLERR